MIKALFAVDHWGGMGFNGSLPWPHNKPDMAHFQKLTNGHIVVMGRRSWDDPKMPKPLSGRTVYIASNHPVAYAGQIKGNLTEEVLRLEKIHEGKIIWIVGGPVILNECRDLYDEVHVTHFKGSYKADTKLDLKKFLIGLTPTYASVASDNNSTFIRYEPLFKRI